MINRYNLHPEVNTYAFADELLSVLTPQAAVQGDELRNDIHMKMLSKSKNAKDCGDLTVIPLGFAVTVALEMLQNRHSTKSSGELEEILDRIGYTPNLDSRAFAREAIESWHTTQTTKPQAEARKIVDQVFIDIPTGHKITELAKVHEDKCSSSQGFMCDCSVLKASQYAVDKAKERALAQLEREHKIGEDGE